MPVILFHPYVRWLAPRRWFLPFLWIHIVMNIKMNALNQSQTMCAHAFTTIFHDWWQQNPKLVTSPMFVDCFVLTAAAPSRPAVFDSQAVWSWPLPWLPSGKKSFATLWHQQGPIPRDIGFSNHQMGEFTHHCYAGTRKDQGYSWVQPWFSGGWFQKCLKALNIPFNLIWWFETASTGQGIETINQEPDMKATSSSFWALEWLDLFFNISHSLMLSTFEGNDVRSCM